MAVTSYKLPASVVQNGTGVNAWADPNNILLVDGDFAVASGPASEILVGGFNISLGQLDTITNITLKVKGYRGSFNTTLAIYAVDDTSGVEVSYPYSPSFQGFDGTNTLYTLSSSLFGTTWTPDQINNIKLKLVADGTLYLDSVQLAVTYTPGVTPVPVTPSSGQIIVDEFVQGIRFQLAQAMTSTDLFMLAESFTMPDGTNIEYADFYGEALTTVDQGILGSEENIRISNVEHDYNGTGLVRISIDSLADRGLGFKYPYESDATRIKAHGGTSEFVISNSAPFYNRFLRKNQIDALVSAPIYISDENVQLADPTHEIDFRGSGVTVVNDGSDTFKKIVTIQGTGVSTPVVVNTSSSTTGDAQATTLTWEHVSSGIDRLLVVQVITEAAKTITGITFNGIALSQEVTATNGTLRSEQWILVAPTVGTYDIVVTMSAAAYITAGAETFVSVNQSAPTGATSTATGSSLVVTDTIATTVDNSIIVDSVGTGVLPMAYTVGAGQSSNWAITANPNVRQGASSIEGAGTTPDNITMAWAITQSTPWVTTLLEICGIPSVVNAGVLTVTGLDTDNTDPQNPIVQISVDGSTITGTGTPGSPLVATAGAGASLVKATAADTTAGYLDDKINIHSSDSSVSVTKSITNPAGNEIVDYDLTVTGTGSGTGPSLIYLGAGTASGPDQQINQPFLLNEVVQNNVGSKKWGAWGTASGGVLFTADKYFYDYDQNLVFGITKYNQSAGNYDLKIEVSSDTAPSTILYTWTTSGFSSVSYPNFGSFGFIVDIQDLKVYLTPASLSGGTNTIDATSISSTKTDVFTLSSSTGGTIDSTATSFSGANKFPAYTSTVSQEQGNSTTKKFILNYDNTKYTYTAVSGITASSVISYGNYSGSNIVLSDGKLYKASTIRVVGSTTGITTIDSYWLQVVEYPGGNAILNT